MSDTETVAVPTAEELQKQFTVTDGVLHVGEKSIAVIQLQRTNKAWHELEGMVKARKIRLTEGEVKLLEHIVIGEASAAQNGWTECKQALAQAGLM